MMLLRNNNRKRRKKKKKKRKTRTTTTTLVSRNALSSRRTRIKTTETTTSRVREVRESERFNSQGNSRKSINPKLMCFCGFRIFSSSHISFVTFEKPARLVGVFKTEKRKRASERETRDVFGRESVFVRVF